MVTDKAHRRTEAALGKLVRGIERVYNNALDDVMERADELLGKIVGSGRRSGRPSLHELVDLLTDCIVGNNEKAIGMINEHLERVYEMNIEIAGRARNDGQM